PKPETPQPSPNPQTPNPEPQTPNPKPQPPNPKPQPKPGARFAGTFGAVPSEQHGAGAGIHQQNAAGRLPLPPPQNAGPNKTGLAIKHI
ncbi:hypothetical protein T484DRAFT_1623669, partial [Baffinella frigidus]